MLPHKTVIGCSESGKSFMLRLLCKAAAKMHGTPLVLSDIGGAEDFPDARIFRSTEKAEFLRAVKTRENTSRVIFIDEPEQTMPKGTECAPLRYIPNTGRHHGHRLMVACHRLEQMEHCFWKHSGEFFIFRVVKAEAEALSKKFGFPALLNAELLEQGDYFHLKGGTTLTLERLKA